MNLLLLDPADLEPRPRDGDLGLPVEARAVLRDERLDHLRRVLRLGPGDTVRAGLLGGPRGSGRVISIDATAATLLVSLAEAPPPPLDVSLHLALPRPKFLGRILQNVASMGVKDIVLFSSARVEKSYWDSRLFDDGALDRHLRLGLEQGRDTVLPRIRGIRRFGDWMEHLEAETRDRLLLVADADGDQPFPRSASGATALVIGPEGGLLDDELEALRRNGATTATLGPRALRVETAVSVCLGRLLP